MPDPFIENFAQRLLDCGLADAEDPLVGCDESEVREIEQKLQVKLPAIYRAYLLKMGRRTGEFLRYSERCYPELLTLTAGAQELLEGSETTFRLPSTAFVFWMSESGYFLFFDTVQGEDPPVFLYSDDDKPPVQKHEHFSQVLDYLLASEIASRDEIEKRRQENMIK